MRTSIVSTILFILLTSSSCVAAQPTDSAPSSATEQIKTRTDYDTRKVIARLIRKLPPDKILAFTGLRNLNNEKTTLTGIIFHEIEPVLVSVCQEMGRKLIERDDLQLILDEWKLEMTGVTKSDEGARALLGADIILTGKVAVKSAQVHTYLKAINLEDGAILASEKFWQPADKYDAPERDNLVSVSTEEPVAKDANMATSSDGNIKVWTKADNFAVGETLEIFFEVSEPAYITLIDITPDGEKTLIFPNPYQKNNYCTPGKTYQIPPDNAPFSLEITPPLGKDRIIAMSSSKPEVNQLMVKTRGIKFTKEIVKATNSRATITFKIN